MSYDLFFPIVFTQVPYIALFLSIFLNYSSYAGDPPSAGVDGLPKNEDMSMYSSSTVSRLRAFSIITVPSTGHIPSHLLFVLRYFPSQDLIQDLMLLLVVIAH